MNDQSELCPDCGKPWVQKSTYSTSNYNPHETVIYRCEHFSVWHTMSHTDCMLCYDNLLKNYKGKVKFIEITQRSPEITK